MYMLFPVNIKKVKTITPPVIRLFKYDFIIKSLFSANPYYLRLFQSVCFFLFVDAKDLGPKSTIAKSFR